MVYYFTSNTVSPSAYVYVGKDKVESEFLLVFSWLFERQRVTNPVPDEDLIAYGVEEDVW